MNDQVKTDTLAVLGSHQGRRWVYWLLYGHLRLQAVSRTTDPIERARFDGRREAAAELYDLIRSAAPEEWIGMHREMLNERAADLSVGTHQSARGKR